MHLKAIAIKEELLGAEDYEVGLSIGHLASLYNYHMKKYKEAEQLYLRSIAISECDVCFYSKMDVNRWYIMFESVYSVWSTDSTYYNFVIDYMLFES